MWNPKETITIPVKGRPTKCCILDSKYVNEDGKHPDNTYAISDFSEQVVGDANAIANSDVFSIADLELVTREARADVGLTVKEQASGSGSLRVGVRAPRVTDTSFFKSKGKADILLDSQDTPPSQRATRSQRRKTTATQVLGLGELDNVLCEISDPFSTEGGSVVDLRGELILVTDDDKAEGIGGLSDDKAEDNAAELELTSQCEALKNRSLMATVRSLIVCRRLLDARRWDSASALIKEQLAAFRKLVKRVDGRLQFASVKHVPKPCGEQQMMEYSN